MSIESMTNMSYVMFGISGVFALAAIVLFFVLDIAKCWRMVSGKRSERRKKRRGADWALFENKDATIKLRCAHTEKISTSEFFA